MNNNYTSRSERHNKRRKNERLLYSLIGIALIFLLLLGIFIFTGKNKENTDSENKASEVTDSNGSDSNNTESEDTGVIDQDETDQDTNDASDQFDEDVVIQQLDLDENEDSNIIEAYVGNWPPIGTSQSEPHTTNYDDDSDDRVEIKKAVLNVTKIDEDNLTEHWVGNGGEQKVIAHVEDNSTSDKYIVYLSWIENEGWQATMVERVEKINIP